MKMLKPLIAAAALTVATISSATTSLSFSHYYFRTVIDPTNGDLYVAGNCDMSQCGPVIKNRRNPVFTFTGLTGIKNVTANNLRTFFLTRNGNVYSTAHRDPALRKFEFHNEVIDMASMGPSLKRHYFIVREGGYKVDGRTYPMGSLWMVDEKVSLTPVKVGDRNDYIMIDAGDWNVGVLNKNGDLWTWGGHVLAYGQGTNDTSLRRYTPTIEPQVTGKEFRFISMGTNHMMAVDMQDRAWSWGSDSDGKLCNGRMLGDGDLMPALTGVENVKTVRAGSSSSLILTNDGSVLTCGWHNLIYQGTSYNRDQDPKKIAFDSATPGYLSNGPNGAYAFLDTTGSAWTWGQDTYGKLGNGDGNGQDDIETHFVGATKRSKTVDAVVLAGDVAWEPLVLEEDVVSRGKDKEKCNASANNGKGGNYEKTGMCDNGKGNGVGRMEATKRATLEMRSDGRGFKRSNK